MTYHQVFSKHCRGELYQKFWGVVGEDIWAATQSIESRLKNFIVLIQMCYKRWRVEKAVLRRVWRKRRRMKGVRRRRRRRREESLKRSSRMS